MVTSAIALAKARSLLAAASTMMMMWLEVVCS